MAAHRLRRGQHDRTGPGQRQREERGWINGDDIRMVWVCAFHYRHHWTFGDDFEYQHIR